MTDEQAAEQVEIQVKYEGYIARQQDEIEKQLRNENTLLPATLDYRQVSGLSNEVIAKLNDHKPASIGQAHVFLASRLRPSPFCWCGLKNRVCCVVAHNALKMPGKHPLTRQRIKKQVITVLNKLSLLLKDAGISLTDHQKNQLIAYVNMLHKWNKAYNLTSVRDPNEMLVRHILDSIVVAPYLQGERFINVAQPGSFAHSEPLSCVLKPISLCWIALVNAYVSFVRCNIDLN